jgi:hypothetical protein
MSLGYLILRFFFKFLIFVSNRGFIKKKRKSPLSTQEVYIGTTKATYNKKENPTIKNPI